jgi:hypothetical protein
VPDQIGVPHFADDDLRHFLEGAVVGGHRDAVPLAARLDCHQGQVVLRPDGAFELAVEHELERPRRQ